MSTLSHFAEVLGVPIFSVGSYATDVDPATHAVLSAVRYDTAELDEMAQTHAEIERSGQTLPPVVVEHEGQSAVGVMRNVRRVGERLYADLCGMPRAWADRVRGMLAGRETADGGLRGRSVEITPNPAAFNYRGLDGRLLVRRLALLPNSSPRVKDLDALAAAEEHTHAGTIGFSEPADGGGRIYYSQECSAMQDTPAAPPAAADASGVASVSLDAILEWVKANPDQIDSLKGLLGMNAEEEAPPAKEEEEAPPMAEEEEEDKAAMDASEVSILRDRCEAAEQALAALGRRHIDAELEQFRDKCVTRYGPARAGKLVEVARARMSGASVIDTFSENGAASPARIFAEILEIAGEATLPTLPRAASHSGYTTQSVQAFDEKALRAQYLSSPVATEEGAEAFIKAERARYQKEGR